jgi:pilus assembly protein CpaE
MADGDKIKIVIVDDNPEARENIKKLLQFEPDFEVLGAASTGREGVELVKETKPDVVLMDINMPGDMDGLDATERITKDVPQSQVVMLSVQAEPEYLRRAMMAGARDFLTKPPSGEDLSTTIRRVYDSRRLGPGLMPATMGTAAAPTIRPGHEGHIVVVFGPKGGVGTTTVAISLAVGFARRGAGSVLVDTDLQFGDVGIFLNVKTPSTVVDLAQSVEDIEAEEIEIEVIERVLSKHDSGCRLLLAPDSPEQAEYVSPASLPKVLSQLSRHYDYVVVDTGTHIDDRLLATLDIASRIIVVATPDIPALKNAKVFYSLLPKINYPLEQTMLVLNRVERRGITTQQVEDTLKRPVVGQIENDPTAMQAVNQGVALISLDPRVSPAVRGLMELVKYVQKDLEESPAEEEPMPDVSDAGILSRLGRRKPS